LPSDTVLSLSGRREPEVRKVIKQKTPGPARAGGGCYL
jgi:hypothetical protein